MLLTGWTADTLRAQPADVVRRLMWRVFARAAWDPEVAAIARAPLPPGSDFAAHQRKAVATTHQRKVEAALFPPEDTDG